MSTSFPRRVKAGLTLAQAREWFELPPMHQKQGRALRYGTACRATGALPPAVAATIGFDLGLLVGTALMRKKPSCAIDTWGQGSSADRETRDAEGPLEQLVTRVIGEVPLLWLRVDDEPGPESQRAYVERNSIGLLSNLKRAPRDPPSPAWLGHQCDRPKVRQSALWNQQH